MSTATLRPNADVFTNATILGGAGSAPAAVNDDSDSTALQFSANDTSTLDFGTVAMGTGAISKSITMRIRCDNAGSPAGTAVLTRCRLVLGGAAYANGLENLILTSIDTTPVTYTSAADTTPFTQTDLDGMQCLIIKDGTAPNADVQEIYADIVYVTQPSTTVTAVSPDPYTASTLVPISWTNTLDSDGGGQTHYEIKVFDETTYGVGFSGLDEDTDTPFYGSGVVASSTTGAVNVGPLLNGDTYRVAVRVAQTVNGVLHWSDWATDDFDLSVTTSDVDTVTAAATSASGYITVTVNRDTGSAAWETIEVQRSLDGGTTWTPIRWGNYVDATTDRTINGVTVFDAVTADQCTIRDYEVANGQTVDYRARATYLLTGLPITGAWVETSSSASWSSTDEWLKIPTDPALNLVVEPRKPMMPARRNVRHGRHKVLGKRNEIVTHDVLPGVDWMLRLGTANTTELSDLLDALAGIDVLLQLDSSSMVGPDHDGALYCSIVSVSEVPYVPHYSPHRAWDLALVETDPPADEYAGA